MLVKANHLGNVRSVIAKATGSNAVEVLSYSDYYPHGGVLPGRNYVSSPSYKMGMQGKEKDPETNFTNFDLRQLDPRLGRWFTPDPMSQYHSPYLAMGNNPVSMSDPTGGFAEGWTEEDQAAWRLGLSTDYGSDAWFQGQFSQNYQHGGASWGSITADGQVYSSYEQINDASELQEKKNKRKAEQSNPQPTGGTQPDPVITGVMLPTVDIATNGRFSYDVHALIQSVYDNMQYYSQFARDGVLYLNGIHASDVNGYIGAKTLANGVPVQDVYNMDQMARAQELWKQYGKNFNDLADASEVAVIGSFAIPAGGAVVMVATEAGVFAMIVGGVKGGVKLIKMATTGIKLESSLSKVMGDAYRTVGEVTTPIKNSELLSKLKSISKGDWVKVYEAGVKDGSKIETHYFRNNTTKEVFDVKTKYDYWHQKAFKNLTE